MVTWALITFASAALRVTGSSASNLAGYAGLVFNAADAVPPLAKISFGAMLALAIFIGLKTRAVVTAVAIPAAFALCLLVLPVAYYPAFDAAQFFPGHFLVAAVGSLVPVSVLVKSKSEPVA